jgi:hypothetical protein
MAELLVLAVQRTHPDPETDRKGLRKKGDIVVVKPDGHEWGAGEGLPTFVRVLCPGLDHTVVEDRIQPWTYNIDFEIVASNLAIDGFRIRATNANAGTSGFAGINQTQIQQFLNQWNVAFVSAANGGVTFDIGIYAAATSEGFWNTNIGSVVFTELDYNQANGTHDIEVNYSADQRYIDNPTQFAQTFAAQCTAVGATVLSNANGVAVIQIERVDVRERFRQDITQRLGVYRRHRYHFTEAQVDTVIAAGGSITVTVPQLTNAVQDRLTE